MGVCLMIIWIFVLGYVIGAVCGSLIAWWMNRG
jgi:hypothetical protein